MHPVAKGSYRDVELFCHISVVLDFFVSLVQVVFQNQISFARWQILETVVEAVVFFFFIRFKLHADINNIADDFSPAVVFANDISRDAAKILRGLANEDFPYVRQAPDNTVDCFIGKIFSIVEASGNEYSDQAGVDSFILSSGQIAIRVQPCK
jgi:hypothetical protein